MMAYEIDFYHNIRKKGSTIYLICEVYFLSRYDAKNPDVSIALPSSQALLCLFDAWVLPCAIQPDGTIDPYQILLYKQQFYHKPV